MSAPEDEDIEESRSSSSDPETTSTLIFQKVSVRLADISKSSFYPQLSTSAAATNPAKRGRGRPRKASYPPTSSVSPPVGVLSHSLSDSDTASVPTLKMGRGKKSRVVDSVFYPTASELFDEDERRGEVSNIDDFLPQGGGPKVQVLSSPNMIDEVYNRFNCNEPEESEIESRKAGENGVMFADDEDDDSEINFKTRDESPHPSDHHRPPVSPDEERCSTAGISNRLYSDKISPKSPKKYRRSSLMTKQLDNGGGEYDTKEEKKVVKEATTKSNTKTSLQEDEKKKSKKRVSFASDVEVKGASEEEPAEGPSPAQLSEEPAGDPQHDQLEVVWAKIGGHPWWPGIVCNDPDLQIFTRTKRRQGNKLAREMNVCFFGDNTRAWVVSLTISGSMSD